MIEFISDPDSISPMMSVDERTVAYIGAPSGAGKSTVASNLIRNWIKTHNPDEVYIISRSDYRDDKAFEGLNLKQIKITTKLIENPIDITNMVQGDTLMVFDDIGTIQEKKLKEAVEKLICDILETGRKYKIWVIVTNHLLIPQDKKFARCMLNEMQSLYVFPRAGGKQQIRYILKTYYGMDKDQINEIVERTNRWVRIEKTYPQFVMTDDEAYLINS